MVGGDWIISIIYLFGQKAEMRRAFLLFTFRSTFLYIRLYSLTASGHRGQEELRLPLLSC